MFEKVTDATHEQRTHYLKACCQNTPDVMDNSGTETRILNCEDAGTGLVLDDPWSCDLPILIKHCMIIIMI